MSSDSVEINFDLFFDGALWVIICQCGEVFDGTTVQQVCLILDAHLCEGLEEL